MKAIWIVMSAKWNGIELVLRLPDRNAFVIARETSCLMMDLLETRLIRYRTRGIQNTYIHLIHQLHKVLDL